MSPLEKHFYVIYTLCIFDSVEEVSSRGGKDSFEKKKRKEERKKGEESESSIQSSIFHFLFYLFREGKHRIIALLATCIFCPINSLEFHPFEDREWTLNGTRF